MPETTKSLAETTIRMLGDRWKMQIIECLMNGTKRFGELKQELGDITQKVLTSNLRMLEENGILIRHVYAQIPPRVDYTLTSIGYSLRPVIDSMVAWAEEYRETIINEFNQKLEQGKDKLEQTRQLINAKIEQGQAKIENRINQIKNNF